MYGTYRLAVFALILIASTAGAGQLLVATDASEYLVGDTVHITITNPTDQDVICNSVPIYGILNADTDQCVYGCVGLPDLETLSAGQVVTADWDTSGDAQGEYTVMVWEMLEGSETEWPEARYTLTDPTPTDKSDWSVVKTLYR